MKITGQKVIIKPCTEGIHFKATLRFEWSNGDHSIVACPTCFNTEAQAEYEGQKALPIMEAELNKLAAQGSLQQSLGTMIGETKRDPNPSLH